MPIKHYFCNDEIVRYVEISGDFSRADLVNYRREAQQRIPEAHRLSFVDLSDMESFSIGIEDTQLHADKVSEKTCKNFTEIVVAPTKLTYGLARMYAASANDRYEVEIYEDKAQAMEQLTHYVKSGATPPSPSSEN